MDTTNSDKYINGGNVLYSNELEGSKVVLAYAQVSRSATLPTLVYGHMSVTIFWIQGSSSFRVCVEKIGDDATKLHTLLFNSVNRSLTDSFKHSQSILIYMKYKPNISLRLYTVMHGM